MKSDDLCRMAKVMRHRLLNIAAGLRGGIRVIKDEAGGQLPEGLLEYLSLMERECHGINDIAQRVTMLFGDLVPGMPENAYELSERLTEAIRHDFPAVELVLRGRDENVFVPGLIYVALREILINACEAAPEGPVQLVMRSCSSDVSWRVLDCGGGVSSEIQTEMLKPFFTTRTRHVGSGLPIAVRICEMLGGKLEMLNAGGEAAPGVVVELSCKTVVVAGGKEEI